MNGRSADERVQSTGIRNKILHCQDRIGIAEMWGREGPERRSGMESEGPEMRWTKYIGLGRLAGRLIRTKDWIESWIRKNMAKYRLETMKADALNVWLKLGNIRRVQCRLPGWREILITMRALT